MNSNNTIESSLKEDKELLTKQEKEIKYSLLVLEDNRKKLNVIDELNFCTNQIAKISIDDGAKNYLLN